MQPAYYENFEEIQKKLWSMLDDAVINRSSPFRIPVFICADQNDIDVTLACGVVAVVLVLATQLISDIGYVFLNPRIRFS